MLQKRIRDYGITIGTQRVGPLNKITDVEGVTVGHSTIHEGNVHTGVTAILPHQGNLFQEKVMGATYVINGFGKTVGTVQIDELGTIETPILLTNTLNIGTCSEAIIEWTLAENPDIGKTLGTVNPVVGECNDYVLNDIRSIAVTKAHAYEAMNHTSKDFEEGANGAGTGMKCFGLKGGIGSSSRIIDFNYGRYTFGVLVLSNFGMLPEFRLNGESKGKDIQLKLKDVQQEPDRGSIMVIVATDLPVTERQLNRIIKRTSVGISRTGSFLGNGSGDIVIGFSTANKIMHQKPNKLPSIQAIHEDDIDKAFLAVADATEEAILNSMVTAQTTVGRGGHKLYSLSEFLS
ncbi:DmpA family aminopeptidase [Tenuibacillus multivorans]|uniref:D-aminopeptidase n=1 Tax=Tenuibacillus multivorans TaxID=237069 RepID=A0A1H0ALX6_9BACI|nr:P1 family peptidase [Tenuibacillus multivorans]SDN34568.1 D-aminopeptidase [Tenuibacillus multivorans]